MFSIGTWNVNSIRSRASQVFDFLGEYSVDVMCLQETKVDDSMFPTSEFEKLGYKVALNGVKRYNGVATVSKSEAECVEKDFINSLRDSGRLLLTCFGDIFVLNAYFPNGREPGTKHFEYKLEFIDNLRKFVQERFDPHSDRVILVGDFNVAMDENDVYDPTRMNGKIGFHPDERMALKRLKNWGFVDALREFTDDKVFSWWDYRFPAFKYNVGMRLDYIWVSETLKPSLRECFVDREKRGLERPSDHAPVVCVFDM